MSNSTVEPVTQQKDSSDTEAARSFLDRLLTDSGVYTQGDRNAVGSS